MTENAPHYLGHRQRLRERFLKNEGADMADYEILELILTFSIPRRDVKPLAKELIKKFGNLSEVVNADAKELLAFSGISENSLALLRLLRVVGIRNALASLKSEKAMVIKSIDAVVDYCRADMCFQDVEELRILFLDAHCQLIESKTMQKGTSNQVFVHPQEIVKTALKKGAVAIVMVHNHPSGDVTPSKADIEITKKIKAACETCSIALHDHIVVSKSDYYSFRNSALVI